MAGLLYYVPNRKHATLADLGELGLAYAFEGDCTPRGTRGPDGADGVILADCRRVESIGHYADRQQWQQIPGNPAGAWVGRYTDQPTLPEDLQRLESLPGHMVRLADGREWLVPVARGWAEQGGEAVWYVALPQTMKLDENGTTWVQGDVLDRYGPLWQLACRWWDFRFGSAAEDDCEGAQRGMDFAACADAAVAALAVNYRLSAIEVSLLGLLADGIPPQILMAVVDWPTMENFLERKKKQEAQEAETSAAGD